MCTVNLVDCALERADLTFPEGDLRAALCILWHDQDGFLLGHAYDGLIWGRLRNGGIELATDYFAKVGALLRAETLLDLRLFNAAEELRIWRAERRLQLCRLTENLKGKDFVGYQDRTYGLLGKPRNPVPQAAPFVVFEGPAGQCHAPPGDPVPRSLAVRHYLESDLATGLLRVAEHRLLGLSDSD